MLTKDEYVTVQGALARTLASRYDPKSLIQVIFLTEADSILLGIPMAATAPDIAAFTLSACLRSRWTRDPSMLESLLDYLVDRAGFGVFGPILVRVRQRIDPNPSVYDSCWLLGDSRPFFDRHQLRGHIRVLIEENSQPILRVRAGENSFGRSYTGKFFEHLAACPGTGIHVATAEVGRSAGPSYQVEDLLGDLGTHLRRSDPLPDRAGSSYPATATRWLLRQMMNNDGLWLVMLDGFGQRPLNDEVRETVEEFARRVTIGEHRQRIRVALVDYPHPLPNISLADILDEELSPAAAIHRADLLPCLAAWEGLRRKKGLPGVAATELARLADEMIGQAPAQGKVRLETLNAQLTALLRMP